MSLPWLPPVPPSQNGRSAMFAELFVIAIAWSLISLCVAAYYMRLLPHEARRRWPIVGQGGCCACIAPLVLFLFAVFFWPGIGMWDFCARYCVATKSCCGMGPGGWCLGGRCCAGCTPCISDEVRREAEERRRMERNTALQQTFAIAREGPPIQRVMQMPPRPASSTKDTESVSTMDMETLVDNHQCPAARAGSAPPPSYFRETQV
ncbi:hypothetical protein B0T25DRAFT_187501 [Lasiosphaeria hispida]|uniref:Uncharacterized protein n=1 Tax=Lasiosphaeria hispida TaxID=260671 RepID=A0AAJ0HH03_9PEZI|nr:hypothetical protein B0T25DRAFT_187501 [Lasiosphaeria hispida]